MQEDQEPERWPDCAEEEMLKVLRAAVQSSLRVQEEGERLGEGLEPPENLRPVPSMLKRFLGQLT